MCAAFESGGTRFRPGEKIGARTEKGPVVSPWAGFVRRESLKWWKAKGAVEVDVPAERFAERGDMDGVLRWEAVPVGMVIRGVWEPFVASGLLRIMTREASELERLHFLHDRIAVVSVPLFSAKRVELSAEAGPVRPVLPGLEDFL